MLHLNTCSVAFLFLIQILSVELARQWLFTIVITINIMINCTPSGFITPLNGFITAVEYSMQTGCGFEALIYRQYLNIVLTWLDLPLDDIN